MISPRTLIREFHISHRNLTGKFVKTPLPSPAIYPHTNVRPPPDFDACKFREWINFSSSGKLPILVMSFNLLSQHYVWKKVYECMDQKYLDWAHYRFPLINETIAQFKCDIMCFQELECSVYVNSWAQHFPVENYRLFYVRKPNPAYWGNKPSEYMDGVGIFINKDRFDVLEYQEVNFSLYIQKHRDKFDVTEDFRNRLAPRNTVAVILKLKDKKTQETVYVANTHLYWLPKFNDVKLLQTKILLNQLRKFIGDEKDPNVILCGDLNSTPDLLVYTLLDHGSVDIGTAEEFHGIDYGSQLDGEMIANHRLSSPFHLSPAYGALLDAENREKLDYTTHTKDYTAILDHIWFSSSRFSVSKVLGKVQDEYTQGTQGFPDKQFPSDHIPLVSELVYN